jgi:hypothetical protein
MNFMLIKDTIKEIHISTPLTMKTIVGLIDEYPNLERITCPESLYKRISGKYLKALENLNIIVEIDYNWGKDKKYDEKLGKHVIELIKIGNDPLEIANNLDLTVKTVYYLKDRYSNNELKLKKGRKPKYDSKTIENVKKHFFKGFSPKEIAKMENISIRAVYYILKK